MENFRSFQKKDIELDPRISILLGNNAVGKTNILESIYFICTGKGLKDDKQEELLYFDTNQARVKALFDDNGSETLRRIVLKIENHVKKAYFVDRSKKLLQHYTTYTPPVVVFAPGRMNIIDGPASTRRNYIDKILSKIDIEYKKRLKNYTSAMRKRNKILEKATSQQKLREDLEFWDDYLIEQANYIYEKRNWFTDFVNSETHVDTHTFRLIYTKNFITKERLEDIFMKQFYQKRTLIGPHRDDFTIMMKKDSDINVHTYGSRGEQRLALMWLLLQEIEIYTKEINQKPIILLDDIFSELDEANKKLISDVIHNYQTVITSTEVELAKWPQFEGKIIKIG